MKKVNHLFILSNGRVAAIDKKQGNIIWEIKLKDYVGSSMSMAIGQLMVEDNKIFVGASGVLLCLDAKDGSLLWKNELKGWGYNFISLAGVSNEAAAASMAATAAAASAATM